MSEVSLFPGVKMSADGDVGLPVNSFAIQQVILWDIGPEKPKAPSRPHAPKGKEGDPEYDLAKVEFKDALEDYEQALRDFKRAKEDHARWYKQNGGPIEISFWSCDAWDALDRDRQAVADGRQTQLRYYISSRTRGHEGLPNRGLPENAKPGHGQAENERREREGSEDLAQMRRSDPVFGEQELRA